MDAIRNTLLEDFGDSSISSRVSSVVSVDDDKRASSSSYIGMGSDIVVAPENKDGTQ